MSWMADGLVVCGHKVTVISIHPLSLALALHLDLEL
jgi:hypothetical protein